MEWLVAIFASLANLASAAAPVVGAHLTREQELEQLRIQLEQQHIQAQVAAQQAEQAQIAAGRSQNMLLVGGLGVAAIIGVVLLTR